MTAPTATTDYAEIIARARQQRAAIAQRAHEMLQRWQAEDEADPIEPPDPVIAMDEERRRSGARPLLPRADDQ